MPSINKIFLGGARNPQDVAPLRTHKPTDCDSITADALEQYILKASRNNRLKFCAQDSYGDSLSDESGYAEEINLKPTKEKLIEKPRYALIYFCAKIFPDKI